MFPIVISRLQKINSKRSYGHSFSSKTKRFTDKVESATPGPGTNFVSLPFHILIRIFVGSYDSGFEKGGGSVVRLHGSRQPPAYLIEVIKNLPLAQPTPPSIPNRHQSYGYEDANDGRLVLQEPVRPGFTGIKGDTVGPGDYEPDLKHVLPHAPCPSFAKV